MSLPEPPLSTGMTHTGMTRSPPEAFYNLKSMSRSLNFRMKKKIMALSKKRKNMSFVADNTNNFEIDKKAMSMNALIKTMANNIQVCSHFTHIFDRNE